MTSIRKLLREVDEDRLRASLFHLSHDPLPYRKLNFTLPGHTRSTLEEADGWIEAQLQSAPNGGHELAGEVVDAARSRRTLDLTRSLRGPRPPREKGRGDGRHMITAMKASRRREWQWLANRMRVVLPSTLVHGGR